jgi:hypothetical protein
MNAKRASQIVALGFVAVFGLPVARSIGAEADHAQSDAGLRAFLQHYAGERSAVDKETRYVAASAKLNAANPASEQVLVYLLGPNWCGSGGCAMLVLDHVGADYKIVTKLSIVQLPVRILESRSHQWRDIGVWVAGGGILHGHEAQLRFNGKSYPRNPSAGAAKPSRAKSRGKEAITETDGAVALYP